MQIEPARSWEELYQVDSRKRQLARNQIRVLPFAASGFVNGWHVEQKMTTLPRAASWIRAILGQLANTGPNALAPRFQRETAPATVDEIGNVP